MRCICKQWNFFLWDTHAQQNLGLLLSGWAYKYTGVEPDADSLISLFQIEFRTFKRSNPFSTCTRRSILHSNWSQIRLTACRHPSMTIVHLLWSEFNAHRFLPVPVSVDLQQLGWAFLFLRCYCCPYLWWSNPWVEMTNLYNESQMAKGRENLSICNILLRTPLSF